MVSKVEEMDEINDGHEMEVKTPFKKENVL